GRLSHGPRLRCQCRALRCRAPCHPVHRGAVLRRRAHHQRDPRPAEMTYDIQAIDCVVNPITPEVMALRPAWPRAFWTRKMRSVGRPISLDAVACDFPELKLVGIHVGIPWTDEMIAMAWKHPNVYIGSDAHSPKYWPASFIQYLNSYGQDKVLFGTDYPVLDF